VVVWEAADWEPLGSRIRGHTSDLSVKVLAASEPLVPDATSTQWRLSRKLADRYAAEAVVWFDAGALRERRVVLRLALPRLERLIERDLGGIAGAADRNQVPSVALESAAVIVREALQALLMGEVVGTSGSGRFDDVAESPAPPAPPAVAGAATAVDAPKRATAPPDTAAPAAAAATPVSAGTQPPNTAAPATLSSSRWAVGVGLQLSADGFGASGATEGLLAHLVWRGPAFELGAMANGNLPVSVHSEAGSVRLTRQQVSVTAGVPLWKAPLGISVGVRLGPILYRRDQLTPSQDATARASATHWLGSAGPVLTLRFPAQSQRFSANLAVGVDVVSHQVEVGYQSANEFVVVQRSWPMLPWAQLGIAISL
jgi:hypothetical protein